MTVDTAAWRRLAEYASQGNPFFGPGLLQAAVEHLGGKKVWLATVVDATGMLIGLAPWRAAWLGRLVPAVSVWTHLHGPLGTPLLDRERLAEATSGLMAIMDASKVGGRILVFPCLPLDGAVATGLRAAALVADRPVATIGVHRRAVIDRVAGNTASVRAGLATKKRRELDRQMRRLGEYGQLEHRRVERNLHHHPSATLKEALDDFFALEASGWKGRRGTALVKTDRDRRFAEAAVAGADGVVIDSIRLDHRPVAMLVSFTAGDGAVTWKIAYDEDLARFSPGVQIMLDGADGLLNDERRRHIDTLAVADHPMVDHLFPDRMAIGTLVIGPTGGSPGFWLGVRLAQMELRIRRFLKKLLRR